MHREKFIFLMFTLFHMGWCGNIYCILAFQFLTTTDAKYWTTNEREFYFLAHLTYNLSVRSVSSFLTLSTDNNSCLTVFASLPVHKKLRYDASCYFYATPTDGMQSMKLLQIEGVACGLCAKCIAFPFKHSAGMAAYARVSFHYTPLRKQAYAPWSDCFARLV